MKGGDYMTDSILQTTKQLLSGITEEDTSFDLNITIFINSVIAILSDLGLAEADEFKITGPETTWQEFLGDRKDLELVKTYIHLKVKLMFDPPLAASALDALKRMIDEHEWRICNHYVKKEVP